MKRYKMDKWGQIPIVPEPEEGDGPWSVRSSFLLLIPITMLIVGVYLLFQYLTKS